MSSDDTLDLGIEKKAFTEKDDTFVIPVGDVIMGGVQDREGNSCAVTQLWWINPDRVPEIKELCEPWIENGFTLHFGAPGEGSEQCPYIIIDEEQQRGRNMAYSASSRGVGAYIGDVLVWLELTNPDKAYDYMLKHANIPVAVRCDIYKYTDDERYKQVFDIANSYFQFYYVHRHPKNVRKTTTSEKELLERLYDV